MHECDPSTTIDTDCCEHAGVLFSLQHDDAGYADQESVQFLWPLLVKREDSGDMNKKGAVPTRRAVWKVGQQSILMRADALPKRRNLLENERTWAPDR